MKQRTLGEFVGILVETLEEVLAVLVEANFLTVDQGVVRASFGEEFHDDRNRIDEHEEGCQDEIRHECKLAARGAGVEEFVQS